MRTGLAIALPAGYAAFVHPRSGLAAKHGVTLVNAPGTVDAGYRGEIKVILLNTDRHRPVSFKRGDRIAQLVIQRVERAAFHEVEVLPGIGTGRRWLRLDQGAHSGGMGGGEPPMSRGGLGGSSPRGNREECTECFVGVVQQTLAGTGEEMVTRSWPTTSR